ncbi:MAG: two-component sensor histidine kinase, partial [Chlamydiia bacterium]|nr:two-component sensor histidine kinase [Chlamydiia bacterium]
LAARNDRLKELGEMAASVAHEIRNPLGGIRGFADLLVRDLASAPELQAMARQIADGAETINRLITHTLNYARPVQLYKTDLDLADLLESVAQVLRLSLPADQQQRIHVECSLPHAPLNCDGLMLKNALCNLTLNGLEASEPDRPVALRLHRDHDRGYRIDIVDEGCGIPEENIEKIFSPFFTTKHCGNGFGLSEALKTVEAHGGTIEVDSQVGHGSTVSLFLP